MQLLFSVFLSPFLNLCSNRLTRMPNELQISSVWTSGPTRPLIPACSSQTLVFPVYRLNEEEYSPQYPHHWEALSLYCAADKPVSFLFLVELPGEGSSGLILRVFKQVCSNSVKDGKCLVNPVFYLQYPCGYFFQTSCLQDGQMREVASGFVFFFRSAPTKNNSKCFSVLFLIIM